MKKILTMALLLGLLYQAQAQKELRLPEFDLSISTPEAHLRFLAADELMGRRTGEPGADIAARYIASYFEAYGLKTLPGAEGYFQPIRFIRSTPSASGTLTIGKGEQYDLGDDLVIVGGGAADLRAEAIFAGHGWVDLAKAYDDYRGLDVKGKVVFILPGLPDDAGIMTAVQAMPRKHQIAAEKGAAALVELYRFQYPWLAVRGYFQNPSLRVASSREGPLATASIPYAWIKEKNKNSIESIAQGKRVKIALRSGGAEVETTISSNVIGMVEGIDPVLKNEYLLLSAHYDHVGAGPAGGPVSPQDSIFNGARDNAFGTTALLAAAKALAAMPPRRSVIFLALTGEEVGLLGSAFYAENPLIPLEKTIFNLNTDGAGYNDVSALTIIGKGRTTADELLVAGAKPFGLEARDDPAPEQQLFDRSDNVSFARKGVPCVTISPGMTGFDAEIMRYYHQVTDEADSVDFAYLARFCQTYAHIARILADTDEKPFWTEGDDYEEAGKELYGR
jgi:hypothetical protein